MKWIAVKTKQDRPKNNGIYFVKIRHSEMFPEEPDQKVTCEIKNGRWQFATGWRVIEWLDESTPPVSAMEDAVNIVKRLAEWSEKYPRGRIYNISKATMDDELVELEEQAKKYIASLTTPTK